jgi:hypothetical protein
MPPGRYAPAYQPELTDEELAAAASPPENAPQSGTYYPPPQTAAPPVPSPGLGGGSYAPLPPPVSRWATPQPGLGGTPPPAPPTPQPGLGGTPPLPVPSEVYGGPAPIDYGQQSDKNFVITSYPSTGRAPMAQATNYMFEKYGRPVPAFQKEKFPASMLAPPPGLTTGGRPEAQANQFKPGPPRNYVPGSTYSPQHPEPDPRFSYMERQAEYREGHGMGFGTVPGGVTYRRTSAGFDQPFPSPGLGSGSAYSPGPLSRWGRNAAPRSKDIPAVQTNLAEPQTQIPGSTYVPDYVGNAKLGDPEKMYYPPQAGTSYGGIGGNRVRPQSPSRIDTIYPATGDEETVRYSGYMGHRADNSRVVRPPNPATSRVYEGTESLGEDDEGDEILRLALRNANVTEPPTDEIFTQMEQGRRERRARRRYGLFGSNK